MTCREQLIEAAINALANGAGAPCPIYAARVQPLSADDDLPCFVITWDKESAQNLTSVASQRELEMRVEVVVAGSIQPIDQKFDPLYLWAVKTLYADSVFQGMIQGFEETGTDAARESAAEDLGSAAITFKVTYTCQRADPSQFA